MSLGSGLVALKNWMLAALPLGLVFGAELDRVSEVVVQDAPILERNREVSTALRGSGSGLWSVLTGVVKGDLWGQVPLDLFPHVLPLGSSRVLLPHQLPSASLCLQIRQTRCFSPTNPRGRLPPAPILQYQVVLSFLVQLLNFLGINGLLSFMSLSCGQRGTQKQLPAPLLCTGHR